MGFFKFGIGGVGGGNELVKFVPFDLKANKKIDNIVDVSDRTDKRGNNAGVGVKKAGAVTGRGGDLGPGIDMVEAG